MVYSTCSMSPYEDEAVVAELLRIYQGRLELVDAREFVPLFSCRKGLSNWLVIDDAPCNKKETDPGKRFKVEEANTNYCANLSGISESSNNNSTSSSSATKMDDGSASSNSASGLEKCLALGMEHYRIFEDVPSHLAKKIRKSMFPPR